MNMKTYTKKFDEWNNLKKNIDKRENKVFFQEREVWLIYQ